MKKRFFSLFLALCMIFSMSGMAFAEDYSTTFTLEGTGVEEWTLSVPATFTMNYESFNFTITSVLPSNKSVTVSIPETLTLTNERGTTYDLNLSISDNVMVGADLYDSQIGKVTIINNKYIFKHQMLGTFTGTLTYTVTVEDVPST